MRNGLHIPIFQLLVVKLEEIKFEFCDKYSVCLPEIAGGTNLSELTLGISHQEKS